MKFGFSNLTGGGLPTTSNKLGFGSVASIGSYGSPHTTPYNPLPYNPGTAVQSAPAPRVATGPVYTAPVVNPVTPQANTSVDTSALDTNKPGFFGKDGFQLNDLGTIVDIIGGFGNLWNGFQQNKLAKQALNFQRESYNTNLANSIASYNLALEDRMRSRYAQKNLSEADAEAKINKHKLGS